MIRRLAVLLVLATPLFAEDKPPVVEIETNYGKLKIELSMKDAPNTVVNFLTLVDRKFYDGLSFHRIIKGFMAQGGDPTKVGRDDCGYKIPSEFNPRKHVKGTISMARNFEPNSASSQFFLCFKDRPDLDNQYTAFGQVIEGLDLLDKIENETASSDGRPLKDVNIIAAKVVSKPEKLADLITIKPEDIPFIGFTPNLGQSVDGVMIGVLRADGGGKRSGLLVGDLIVKVGDVEVKTYQDYAKAILPVRPGKAITFTVKRKGEEVKVEVTPLKM